MHAPIFPLSPAHPPPTAAPNRPSNRAPNLSRIALAKHARAHPLRMQSECRTLLSEVSKKSARGWLLACSGRLAFFGVSSRGDVALHWTLAAAVRAVGQAGGRCGGFKPRAAFNLRFVRR